jgi:hypothetical protein
VRFYERGALPNQKTIDHKKAQKSQKKTTEQSTDAASKQFARYPYTVALLPAVFLCDFCAF